MPHDAELVFSYPDAIAAAVAAALTPEREAQVPKSVATIEYDGGTVRVRVRADDAAALRAAVNSYARWVDAAERAARVARPRT